MKKVLVFTSSYDNLQLDIAKERLMAGDEVFLLVCDKSAGYCIHNMGRTKQICQLCSHVFVKKATQMKCEGLRIHIIKLSDLLTRDIVEESEKKCFTFTSVAELKDIKYEGVDIGYAAFSTYASYTRNIYPTINDFFIDYINNLLQCSIRIVEVGKLLIKEIAPNLVVVHNGRHVNLKPLYQLAKENNIDYIVTERMWNKDGEDLLDNYLNDIPHSARKRYEKMIALWGNGGKEKEEIAKSFFENRRYGKYAGDKIYTLEQHIGELPNGFDKTKTNIAIFNSSEDEFYSISKEYDDSGLFRNQYEALTSIFEHFKDNKDVHFYLRIHPNLANVPWKSHTDLYKLHYDNLTIIPPKSSVSSYALLDVCNKIIVFDSTMGLEGAYWKKPVVLLNLSYYTYMDIAYTPQSIDELFSLLINKELSPKMNDNCLKAAYMFMGGGLEKLRYYPTVVKTKKIFGKDIFVSSAFSIFGSSVLYGLVMKVLNKLADSKILGKYGLTDIKMRTV